MWPTFTRLFPRRDALGPDLGGAPFMTPPELSTSPPVADSSRPKSNFAPRDIAADAPFIVVMNAGSGGKQSDEMRAALDDILGRAGRKFELRMVADPFQLADTARQAVRDAQ